MDLCLQKLIELKFGKKPNDSDSRQLIILQQTRVVDDKGQLKTTYPSRTDLHWIKDFKIPILIERLTIDK